MAAALKPLSQVSPGDIKADFVGKIAAKSTSKTIKKNPFKKLSDLDASWVKMLIYGHTGTGKTLAIKGFLEAGLKILVITTDFGGSGLSTVRNALKVEGKEYLMDNLENADFSTYAEVEQFLLDPESVYPGIYDLDIDMIVWEGFSGFQQNHVSSKVADIMPQRKGDVSEARESGLQFEMQDWGMIRNGTLRPLVWFLNLHNKKTGKKWHKYMTALEANKEDTLQKEKMTGPLLQGSAFNLIGPAFDIIIQTTSKTVGTGDDKKEVYFYNCGGNAKLMAKTRGYNVEPVEPADMRLLWGKIAKQLPESNLASEATVEPVAAS